MRAAFFSALPGWLLVVGIVVAAPAQDSPEDAEREMIQLRELSASVADPSQVLRDFDKTAADVELLAGYRANLDRLRKQFGGKLDIRQQPYSELRTHVDAHQRDVDRYGHSVRENVASLQLIDQDLEQILQWAKIAVDNQAPLWFQPDNDIYRTLNVARQRLKIVILLDGESAATRKQAERIQEVERQIEEIARSLSREILESNPVPPDEYQGPDREKLLQVLQQKWQAEGTGRTVLKSGIVASQWNRAVTWEWRDRAFHKYDTSRLQGWVLVEDDADVAVRHSLNFVIDHLAGDSLSASWVIDPKTSPPLSSRILRSKIN